MHKEACDSLSNGKRKDGVKGPSRVRRRSGSVGVFPFQIVWDMLVYMQRAYVM